MSVASRITCLTIDVMLPSDVAPTGSRSAKRSERVKRRPIAMIRIMPAVMIPSPPIYIRPVITNCPKPVQYVALSTITSPVTQAADVAVKKATSKGALPEAEVEIGRESITVPMPMRSANPPTKVVKVLADAEGGLNLRLLRFPILRL